MQANRRTVIATLALAPLAPLLPFTACAASGAGDQSRGAPSMYGLIGKMKTQPGQRDALAAILLQATRAMPGCLSYIVAADATDADALWITEVWRTADDHKASLGLPAVKAALVAGRPLIAGFGERFETRPMGGVGDVGDVGSAGDALPAAPAA